MNRKFLSVFIVILFAYSVFVITDMGGSDGANVTSGELYVNGVDVIDHPELLPSGCTFTTVGHIMTFNQDVELNQCHTEAGYPSSPIWYKKTGDSPTVNIVLSDANVTIRYTGDIGPDGWSGIYSNSSICLSGTGTLTIIDERNNIRHGIEVYSLTVESGAYYIDVHGGGGTADISAVRDFYLEGGTIHASRCIEVTHEDGTVDITGGEITFSNKGESCSIRSGTGEYGTFDICNPAVINFNFDLAADDNVINAHTIDTHGSIMSENLEVAGTYVRSTGAGYGWIGLKTSTITFNANGGTCATESAVTSDYRKLATLPDATREGYTFDGWFTDPSAGTQISTTTTFSSNTTVYAHWTALTRTITFDANGGTCATASAVTDTGGKLAELPMPTYDGYTFDGWYTAATGGDKITTDTVFDSDTTVYAHWTESGGGGGTEGGSGGINWNPDFDRLVGKDLRLAILLAAVTALSLLIMCSYIFGKKE